MGHIENLREKVTLLVVTIASAIVRFFMTLKLYQIHKWIKSALINDINILKVFVVTAMPFISYNFRF
jgi:hypothetical protein